MEMAAAETAIRGNPNTTPPMETEAAQIANTGRGTAIHRILCLYDDSVLFAKNHTSHQFSVR